MGDYMDEIDLDKYEIRTDLALESVEDNDNINVKKIEYDNIVVSRMKINKNEEEKTGKKQGIYSSIEYEDITDTNNFNNVKKVFCDELKFILNKLKIKNTDECLIIGLGNEHSTPDALGPKTINNIFVTRHLFSLTETIIDDGYRCVSAFNPGVMGITGIETSDVITSIINTIKPKFIIVIDALLASSIEKVNKIIQITDSGINPGSGVGNYRNEITKKSVGIPVIALGIPTVVDATTIVSDTINFMMKNFSYMNEFINNPINKMVPYSKINYAKKESKPLSMEDKNKYIGVLGTLEEEQRKKLIYEVLSPIDYNLIVTPKEIDFLLDKMCMLLSSGINCALHENKFDKI